MFICPHIVSTIGIRDVQGLTTGCDRLSFAWINLSYTILYCDFV